MTDFCGNFWIINTEDKLSIFNTRFAQLWEQYKWLSVQVKTGKNRTQQQNAALHLFLTMVAQALNEQGITFEQFFKEGFQVPWTQAIVKENVWQPLQKAVTGQGKTSKAERGDYSKVYDPLNMKLAELGVHVPWPVKQEAA